MLKLLKRTPVYYNGSNSYFIGEGDTWAVIDPSVIYQASVKEFPEIAGKIKYILLTHGHYDHFYGIETWLDVCSDVRVGAGDAAMLADPALNCSYHTLSHLGAYKGNYSTLQGGEVLEFGNYNIEVMSVPGHTPGGLTYKIGDYLFVGDTIFYGGNYGRCDLPLGDARRLDNSIARIMNTYPDCTFYPGHGPADTMKEFKLRYR